MAVSYDVHPVSSPGVTLYLDSRRLPCAASPTKPMTVALAGNGAVAMIFPPDYVYGYGARDIFLLRANGSRVRLSVPPLEILARNFRLHERKNGKPQFQDVYFQSVRLADDGTPLATVASHFSGAYSGIESAVFRWNGVGWRHIPPRTVMTNASTGAAAVNTQIAAADTATRAAFNGVYAQQWHPDLAYLNDPRYLLNQAEFMDGDRVVPLGAGTATAIRGATVVGFKGGMNALGPTCERPRKTYATKWANGHSYRIGSGVAYDVNAGGQTVGDNEIYLGKAGQPVLWSNGRTFVLDRRMGSAYAIAHDGTIVGRVGNAAFIADARHPKAAVKLLDGVVATRGWHIIAAYGVARRGRILAVGSRNGALAQVVVLDPRSSSR